jgi:hypothetical protein
MPFENFDPNQKCNQVSPQWKYSNVETKCLYDEAEMAYFADACCLDGVSVCPISQLCKDDTQYNSKSLIFENQRCNQVASNWAYTDPVDQCDSFYGKDTMATYAFNCCDDFESICGFFPICEDPTMFIPEKAVDTRKYNSLSGIMRCAEIAAALSSEYTNEISFCADGSIPDLSDNSFDFYDVFAFECCSDKISVCAEYISVDVIIELTAPSPPNDADRTKLKFEIANALGVETFELEAYKLTSDEVWTVSFSVLLPIPSLGSAEDAVARADSKLQSSVFALAVQESVGATIVSVTTSSSSITDVKAESSKKISTLGLLIIVGVVGLVLLCAFITWMLPPKNKPQTNAPSAPETTHGHQNSASTKTRTANKSASATKKPPLPQVHIGKSMPSRIVEIIAEEERKLDDV